MLPLKIKLNRDYAQKIKEIHSIKNINDKSISLIQNKFYEKENIDKLKVIKIGILKELIKNKILQNKTFYVQRSPTLRIYKPSQHGSSFHTDYYYGHPKNALVIWVPLFPTTKKNSIYFVNHDVEKEINKDFKNLGKLLSQKDIDIKCMENSYSYDLGHKEILIFPTTSIHGSPINNDTKTRLSIDFRITPTSGGVGSKDISNYDIFSDGTLNPTLNDFSTLIQNKTIKLIFGGKDFSTQSQHILINSYAQSKLINISAQEAEIEKLGYPILHQYLNGLLNEKKLDGIIVASKGLLPKNLRLLPFDKNKKFLICCAENKAYSIPE